MKTVIEKYIDFTKKSIQSYLKMILVSKYNAEIVDEFIKTYINIRFYNIYNQDYEQRPFYLKIMDELNSKSEKLKEKNNEDVLIDTIKDIFYYILFWDDVRNVENVKSIKNISKTIEKVESIREERLNLRKKEDFAKNLYEEINDNKIAREVYIDNFETDKFSIEMEKVDDKHDLYFEELKYNIKMPTEYTKETIENVFAKGIIAEEKLKVEYTLLAWIILQDIIKGEFKDVYISNLPASLFKKSKKFDSTIELINNQVLQEKIYLNIDIETFNKYKDEVLSAISNGFNFCVTLDNEIEDIEQLYKMKMIKAIFVHKNNRFYKEIKKVQNDLKNIIML